MKLGRGDALAIFFSETNALILRETWLHIIGERTFSMESLLVVLLVLTLGYKIQPFDSTGVSVCRSAYDAGLNKDGAFQFPVFHRDHHPCLGGSSSASSVHLQAAAAASLADASPVVADDAIHEGKFFMVISIGTPSVYNLVTIDTGSTLSWVQCGKCEIHCHNMPEAGAMLYPSNSTTYRRIGCSSEECAGIHESLGVLYGCVEETDTCLYSLRYGSGPLAQYSVGRLGRDRLKLTLADGFVVVHDFIFGCSQDDRYEGHEAGIVGFANESFSFFTQVARRTSYAAFSYCFPGNSQAQGFLSIGPYARDKLAFASMKTRYGDRLVYSLQQLDMTVDGERLQLDPSVYRTRMIIVDSGTADTYLLSPVFHALDEAMTEAMRAKGYSRARQPGRKTTAPCFSRFVAGDHSLVDWSDLPAVEMRFTGAAMKLPPENVFRRASSSSSVGVICLAFLPDVAGVRGVQILGSWATRSFRVVYDLQASMFGFQPRAC